MIQKKKTSLSSFFDHHPALPPSLFFLLGLALAIKPSLSLAIPGLALVLPFLQSPKKVIVLTLIGAASFFYGKSSLEQFPDKTSSITGSALFSLSEIKAQQSHFKTTLHLQGTITSIEGDSGEKAYNIPCRFLLPSAALPLKFSKYEIFGTLEKKKGYFSFTPVPKVPWKGIGKPFCLAKKRYELKKKISAKIKKSFSNTRVSNFFIALTLGDLNDKLLRFSFNKLGLQHILAISGFHFSLLSLLIGSFFRFFLKEKLAILALLITLTLYFLLLQSAPSIIRAYFAITLYLIGKLKEYRPNALNLLGITLLLELLIAPKSVTNLGFQLSFLATGSILLLFPLTLTWMKKLFPRRTPEAALSLSPLDKVPYLICCMLRSTLAVNLSVYLTLIPTCLWLFGSFPLISLLYNLFIPFTIFISMLLLLLALPMELFCSFLAKSLHQTNEAFTGKILQLLTESPNCLDTFLILPFLSAPLLYLHILTIFFIGIKFKNKNSLTLNFNYN